MEQLRYNAHRTTAFTLMELLVVISIVAILSALALPGFREGGQRVKSAICLNNLKQWGLATQLYALEHDDWLPKDGAPNGTSKRQGWYIDLPAQLGIPNYHTLTWRTNAVQKPPKCLWICPANRTRSNGNNLFHYCLNAHVNGSGAGNQIKLSSIPSPGKTIWLFDNGKRAAVAQHNNVHTNLHAGGAQFSFLDGHSQRFRNEAYWDFKIDRGKLDHPELHWIPTR
jgi:prepilin-type N-terminal cleavage/methylation domain-containing protein/prepilin-type processing-associated H-X9-DG protein